MSDQDGGGFFSGYTKGYDPSQLIAQSMLGSVGVLSVRESCCLADA